MVSLRKVLRVIHCHDSLSQVDCGFDTIVQNTNADRVQTRVAGINCSNTNATPSIYKTRRTKGV